jgi:hypothetical protein
MFQAVYDQYEATCALKDKPRVLLTALQQRRLQMANSFSSGFDRMARCRKALEALDGCGWTRSYHQRLFHDTFIRACSRVFWKTEKAGQFARDHQRILQFNGWEHLSQEILVSTPRR